MTTAGLVAGFAPVVVAGAAVLSGLAVGYVASLPLSRVMRRKRLEFSWWIKPRVDASGSAQAPRRPDEPVALRVTLRNPTDETLRFSTPRLALSPGLRYTREGGARVEVPPRSLVAFDLEVSAAYAGRHVLHGAWMSLSGPLGVVWVPLYFPSPLVLEVQPRGAGGLAGAQARTRNLPSAVRTGKATRRAGEGPELRELRDHQPGDPYRRIAWGPSARRGKLLVRETEDESQTTRCLVVDASATMRGDDSGRARLDYVIEVAAQAARAAQSAGDRLGLWAFDRRVVSAVAAGDGSQHLRALVQSAIELRGLVDEDLTDLDDEGLIETVARYFREQEGVDVFRGARAYEARERILRLIERSAGADPAMRVAVRATEHTARVMRAFCRARAITLPLKVDPSGEAKMRGLVEALGAAMEGAREPRTLLVLSDLDQVGSEYASLRKALGVAKMKRHRVSMVVPVGDDFMPRVKRSLAGEAREAAEAVRSLLLAEEQSRVEGLRGVLGKLGVPLLTVRAGDGFARILRVTAARR